MRRLREVESQTPSYCVTWSKKVNLSEHQFLICEMGVRTHPLHGAFVKSTSRGQPALGQVRRTHHYHSGATCEQHTGRAGLHGTHLGWPCPSAAGQHSPEATQLFLPTPRQAPVPAYALRERGQPARPRFSGGRGLAAGERVGQDRLGKVSGPRDAGWPQQCGGHPKGPLHRRSGPLSLPSLASLGGPFPETLGSVIPAKATKTPADQVASADAPGGAGAFPL